VKSGKVTAVTNKDKVMITYTAGGKTQTKSVNKPNHGFKKGQVVFVTHKSTSPYTFVSVSATKPGTTPTPAPKPASTSDIKTGKVTSVLNKDVVIVSYFAGGKDQIKNIGKPNHGFKKGQTVYVTTKPAPDHGFVSVSATKPAAGAAPAPNPANDVRIGKATAVPNKDTVTITYFAAGKNQTKTITKPNHGFKKDQTVYVTISPPPAQDYLSVNA
jgi:hypothetical protein